MTEARTARLTFSDIVKMAMVLKPRWRIFKRFIRQKRRKAG